MLVIRLSFLLGWICCLKALLLRRGARTAICMVYGETDVPALKFWIHFPIQRLVFESLTYFSIHI